MIKLRLNLREFGAAMQREMLILDDDFLKFHRRLVLEALSRIVKRTPVDTGRARGNWQTSIGQPARGEKRSADPVSAGAVALRRLAAFQVVWLTNNVEYITYLEEGSSTQAPNGMVALTFAELKLLGAA